MERKRGSGWWKLVSLWFCVVMAVSGHAVAAIPPSLTIDGHPLPDGQDQVERNAGDDVMIVCNYESKFVIMKDPIHNSIRQWEEVDIALTDAQYTDTGEYSCWTEDEPHHVATVYVYIKDVNNLLLPTSGKLYLNTDGDTIVPCRVSTPEATVGLYEGEEQLLQILGMQGTLEYIGEPKQVPYDPRKGFFLSQTVYSDLACLATLENKKNFDVFSKEREIKVGNVMVTGTRYVPTGDNIVLQCTIEHEANDAAKFPKAWILPEDSTAEQEGRKHQVDVKSPERSKTMMNLTITNVKPEDVGEYECTAGSGENKHIDKHQVVLLDDSNVVLNVTSDTASIVADSDERINWVISFEAFPDPVFRWFHNGEEIDLSDHPAKYEISEHSNMGSMYKIIAFSISSTGPEDSGRYTALARVTRRATVEERNVTVDLFIKGPPIVTVMSGRKDFYAPNKTQSIVCKVIGYPTPTVKWLFKRCEASDVCENVYTDVLVSQNNAERQINRDRQNQRFEAELILVPKSPGYYKCEANIGLANDAVTFPFIVSGFDNGFDLVIHSPDDKVLEGDAVILTCGASLFNFTGPVKWTVINEQGESFEITGRGQEATVTDESTSLDIVSSLRFSSIKLEQNGRYTCSVGRGSGLVMREKEILVIKVEPPLWTAESTMSNERSVQVETGEPYQMNCSVSGVPTPTIQWTKDDIKIKPDERVRLENNGQVLRFISLTDDDSGLYQCTADNKREGSEPLIGTLELTVLDEQLPLPVILGCVGALLVVLVIVIIFLMRRVQIERKKYKAFSKKQIQLFKHGNLTALNPEMNLSEQAHLLPYKEESWEFPEEKLSLGQIIGEGAFGQVMKAEAEGIVQGEARTVVAVKLVKDNAEKHHHEALASELKIMCNLGKHLNIVNLLGACTKNMGSGNLKMIVEYCTYGSLEKYLRRHGKTFVDQIDPITREINVDIGRDILQKDLNAQQASLARSTKVKYSTVRCNSGSEGYEVPNPIAVPVGGRRYTASMQPGGPHSPNTPTTPLNDVFFEGPMQPRCSVSSNNSSSGYASHTAHTQMTSLSSDGSTVRVFAPWAAQYRGQSTPLRDHIFTYDLLVWSYQISQGMEYLASRKVVHRDLAARNVLLTDGNVVKICDFGLARETYHNFYKRENDCPLPYKWMAMESLSERVSTSQSDVWSFGVTIWEIFTLGRDPYPGQQYPQLLENLHKGLRLEQPKFAPDNLYNTMISCWEIDPILRPTFSYLTEHLGRMLHRSVSEHYKKKNEPYMNLNEKFFEDNHYLKRIQSQELLSPYSVIAHRQDDDFGEPYLRMDADSRSPSQRLLDEQDSPSKMARRKYQDEGDTEMELQPLARDEDNSSQELQVPSYHVDNPNYTSGYVLPNPGIVENKGYITGDINSVENPNYHLGVPRAYANVSNEALDQNYLVPHNNQPVNPVLNDGSYLVPQNNQLVDNHHQISQQTPAKVHLNASSASTDAQNYVIPGNNRRVEAPNKAAMRNASNWGHHIPGSGRSTPSSGFHSDKEESLQSG